MQKDNEGHCKARLTACSVNWLMGGVGGRDWLTGLVDGVGGRGWLTGLVHRPAVGVSLQELYVVVEQDARHVVVYLLCIISFC